MALCVVVVKSPTGQALALNAILGLSMLLQLGVQPYSSTLLNVMETIGLASLYSLPTLNLLGWVYPPPWDEVAAVGMISSILLASLMYAYAVVSCGLSSAYVYFPQF